MRICVLWKESLYRCCLAKESIKTMIRHWITQSLSHANITLSLGSYFHLISILRETGRVLDLDLSLDLVLVVGPDLDQYVKETDRMTINVDPAMFALAHLISARVEIQFVVASGCSYWAFAHFRNTFRFRL